MVAEDVGTDTLGTRQRLGLAAIPEQGEVEMLRKRNLRAGERFHGRVEVPIRRKSFAMDCFPASWDRPLMKCRREKAFGRKEHTFVVNAMATQGDS
jgi:hypothetical protein